MAVLAAVPDPLGRDRELGALEAVLKGALDGRGRAAVVEGEPGIGKTLLLDLVASRARSLGFRVLRGGADELQYHPYAPLVEALRISPNNHEERTAELVRLLHDVPVAANRQLSFRIDQLILELLAGMAAEEPLVVVLDDLQWADRSTLAVATGILRRFVDAPVALVAARRLHPTSPGLESFVERVERGGGDVVRVAPLDAAATAALVARLLGGPPGPNLSRQLAAASGNPLFVRELVDTLHDAQELDAGGGAVEARSCDLPPSLRLTILRRLSTLGESQLALLRLASLLGTSFSVRDLALLARGDVVEVAERLQAPLRAGFLVEAPAGMAFRHDLVREALYHEMPADMRAALHLEAARCLADAGRPAIQVATQLSLGASAGDTWGLHWLRRAAAEAAPRAPALAAELLDRALEVAGDGHPERVSVLADQVLPLVWAGRLADAVERGEEALGLHPTLEQEGRVRVGLMRAYLVRDLAREALPHAQTAQTKPFSAPIATQLLAETAFLHALRGELREAIAAGKRAVELGATGGDAASVITAQCALAHVALMQERVDDALASARQAAQRAEQDDELRHGLAENTLATILLLGERPDEAHTLLRQGLAWAERTGAIWMVPDHVSGLAWHAFFTGDWDQALVQQRRWVKLQEESAAAGRVSGYGPAAVIAVHRGDLRSAGEALALADRLLGGAPLNLSTSLVVWGRALHLEASGRTEAAVELLWEAWRIRQARGFRSHQSIVGPDLVRMALSVSRRDVATAAGEAIEDTARAARVRRVQASALYVRGLLSGDPKLTAAAAGAYRAANLPLFAATAAEATGRLLADAGRAEPASGPLEEAVAGYRNLGAAPDVRRANALLRKLRDPSRVASRPSRPRTGWEALTQAEMQVVALVAEGLSNPDVARRLFVSRRTVDAHLRSIFRKLGISSRGELAAAAARRRS